MKLIESLETTQVILQDILDIYTEPHSVTQDIINEYLNLLKSRWTDMLSSLEPLDLFLLLSTFIKDGQTITSILEGVEPEVIEDSLKRLEKYCLCILRYNISHLKVTPKLYMFDEVRAFFAEDEKIQSFHQFQESLSQIDSLTSQITHTDIPDDIIHFFYSYGFHVPQNVCEQSIPQDVLLYLKQSGFLQPIWLISVHNPLTTKSYLCYKLNITTWNPLESPIVQVKNCQSQVINDLARLVFQIQKEGLRITKRDEMSKKSLEKFYKIIPQESLLWFLLQFLRHRNYLELVENETYKISENFLYFFKKSLQETYEELLKSDPVLYEILTTVKGLPASMVSFADILLAYLKKHPSLLMDYMDKRELRRTLLLKVELLHYLGIFEQKYLENHLSFYSLSEYYKNSINYHSVPKPILTLSTSFQIMGDMEQIPPQVSYLLSLFGDIESLSPALSFKIEQHTFHRALYFGFSMHELVDILNHYSKIPPDAFIIQSLEVWTKNFKIGYIQEGIILHAPVDVLDELEHKPEYALYLKKRISSEYAIVSIELKTKRILEKSNIYFFLHSKK